MQSFGENNHLGEDWNDFGGCNNDLGKSVHSIANGIVTFADDLEGGWGKVVRIAHRYTKDGQVSEVESLYALVLEFDVQKGDIVTKGQQIAKVGNAGGVYCAHLHLELRTEVGLPIGGGYSANQAGYTSPTKFIKGHRKV